ncbi:serine hydroxymethyltransferase [Xenorhabdus nematophila]|uniref:Serine hydroxymethyltransferase n=1 Tax=Xenorhabdus nematophila (strain ATCC 19061 / DSM 3370 / CCUG 14189 / LMG 1036 / NCIMB 9965 / AN6) TaxID=406817 RepID=D3VDM0_XENNA|nr:serine hydroxymethyltransferase [Xenorhabdus nematophila]AYA41967.1 serine hydroxymethyltransferase [Xenorhabdus nematophila]MCB4426753.1 aminotransferase class I/II-fold pyridoxal phosphate-dependent enzyme [Xenorhabdus nematophila]QNJ36343.1 serine hydroxymethyltransferase [Xenorhabdus nematophila]CBJ92260.1 serine hydroxymethyltransferase [Xenorhabdus nematophila ATCC 19061]CEK25075.1 serine hydroxymethyltransferase [Xenorhabdus nematophila AN6/1]
MLKCGMNIANYDPELWQVMEQEVRRQEEHIELIASENYTSPRVMQAQGSQLTNKYAEGYPGKRYYGGCEYIDIVEQLAINRAKELFGADYANVQPHSGSQANMAVYMTLLQPGDTVLGMNLAHGGHLTHGSPVNFSGKLYNVVPYGIDENGKIDYDDIRNQALKHQPKMIIGGFSAYSGVVDWAKMREISDEIGAYLFVDMAHVAGLIAAGVYPNPVPHAHVVTTTTHKTLAGPRGGLILAKGGDEELYKKLNSAVFPCGQGGPLMHVIAGKAVALKEAMEPEFRVYQRQVAKNAKEMVDVFLQRGYKIVSGGTENHLMLLDLVNKDITGKEADAALGRANITVNKNSVPNDPRSPFVTSGIRIGTPAITRRGFKEAETRELAVWICDVLDNINDESVIECVKQKVLGAVDVLSSSFTQPTSAATQW